MVRLCPDSFGAGRRTPTSSADCSFVKMYPITGRILPRGIHESERIRRLENARGFDDAGGIAEQEFSLILLHVKTTTRTRRKTSPWLLMRNTLPLEKQARQNSVLTVSIVINMMDVILGGSLSVHASAHQEYDWALFFFLLSLLNAATALVSSKK